MFEFLNIFFLFFDSPQFLFYFQRVIMSTKISNYFLFLLGFVIGVQLFYYFIGFQRSSLEEMSFIKASIKKLSEIKNLYFGRERYNETIADSLYDEIKIVCLVLTYPPNHQTRAVHIKNTWGRGCNKLIFLSTEADEKLGAIEIPFNEEDREILWGKVRNGFKYAYEHHYDEADWVLKADDDS